MITHLQLPLPEAPRFGNWQTVAANRYLAHWTVPIVETGPPGRFP
ncbi:MAG TPA: hypothetical protein VFR11_06225 [Micromonosporaceae bacterium]|jgi:hypothetical protein|nr:hypothetical protein [Micromonosporaceae bacterium]